MGEAALRDVPPHALAAHLPVCDVHPSAYRHHPRPVCTPDWHHLLPREWQRAWIPSGAIVVTTSEYGPVWAPAGVYCTPTCHHNVHVGIVATVHAWTGDTAAETVTLVRQSKGAPALDDAEWKAAGQALDLWMAAGGDPAFLQEHHLWGQA